MPQIGVSLLMRVWPHQAQLDLLLDEGPLASEEQRRAYACQLLLLGMTSRPTQRFSRELLLQHISEQ